ncbi:MAG: transporter suffix domain-containing protein [Bacteroidetes bacterium]|jgi:hypothetical protein|nr:transporter suffix domain-containing protein [Bacteroidota bacterium]MBT3750453.1 transporter suffix domain-containing protein [Bacteroidota bacterium]MBT4397870.1 transporter suffix domain-containing protein [Bacteroidota bacterium]MBT4411462.1 transporter suffix domain-containing protein [Bacteroidota bacterium]MBT7465962.1 transporter suffix domain-containing protein [Bacteroidota bacterium]
MKNWIFKLGVVLMIISVPFFLCIPIVPFLDVETKTKVTLTTILLVSGEVLFWAGGLLVGKELFTKYKSYMNPRNWFRKKSTNENSD